MNAVQDQVVDQGTRYVDPLDFSGASLRKEPNGTVTQDAHAAEAQQAAPKEQAPAEASEFTAEELELAGVKEQVAEATPWTDDFKKLFKDTTGYDGPEDFKTRHGKMTEEHRMLSEQGKELKTIKDRLSKVHPHVLKALEMEQQKAGSGQKYLRSLPDIDLLNKDAAKLTDKEAIAYLEDGGGITDADWAMLNDPDADPGVVAAFKQRLSFLRRNGEDLHRSAQNQMKAEHEAGIAAQEALNKRFTEGTAAAIAQAKNSNLKAYITPSHIQEMERGTFINRFFEDDGVTPKPNVLEAILKSERFDEMRETTQKVWYKKGKEDGLAQATAGMPATPRQVGARATPTETSKTNPWAATLDAIERS